MFNGIVSNTWNHLTVNKTISVEYLELFTWIQNRITGIIYQCLEPFGYANEWIVLNRIISVKEQYLKPLHCVQTND